MTDEPLSLDAAADMVSALDHPAPEAEVPRTPEDDVTAEAVAPETDNVAYDVADDAPVGDVEAPRWWDAAAQSHFSTLPAEVQAIVRVQEDKREAVTQKEKAAALQARQVALAEAERVRAVTKQLSGMIPDRVAEFETRYRDFDHIDWDTWNAQDPVSANRYLAGYQAEKLTLERMLVARAEADTVAERTFLTEQSQRLSEIAPELSRNPETLRALGDYARTAGIRSEDLRYAEADHLVILDKARRYDEMMKRAAARPASASGPAGQTKQPPTRVPPVKVPPLGAARPAGTSHNRETSVLANRFAQTRSVDDAAALIAKLGLG